ncbi:ATP-binding protein [Patescibacteria group bacterium]
MSKEEINKETQGRVEKLVQQEIRKARDYFRAVIDHSPVGICVTDLARKVVIVNDAAIALTGYSHDDLIGSTVMKFYPKGEEISDIDIKALRAGERKTREIAFVRNDGEEVPVLITYSLVEDLEGFGNVIVESYNDQTVRKRLDRLKNEFVFVAAHELRNPVTAIRLLLDIIFDDKRFKVDPILRGYLQKMQEANDRLIQLVDDLLEVSRSESGRLKIKVEHTDVKGLMDMILEELRPSAVSKEIELKYEPPKDMPPVLADGSKLKEIISNLVSNAIKYNVSGGSVIIEHEILDNRLLTRVIDTGIGISDEDLARLFQKFWRSEDVAVRAQSGTGLGLFIVKELVERMGGTISASSEHGKGSTFNFSLPLVKGKKRKK